MKHERSSNFELLRLLCIFGILVMHTFAGIGNAASPGNMLAERLCQLPVQHRRYLFHPAFGLFRHTF